MLLHYLVIETLMSVKQAINDKLHGSLAAYLRCGWVVDNQIKKGLLLSLRVKKVLKLVNIWQTYQQERDCLVHFLRLLAVCWPGVQSAWDNHALACNFAGLKKISLTLLIGECVLLLCKFSFFHMV